jgi:glycosyltransferase involved in cell wall biosynthesis
MNILIVGRLSDSSLASFIVPLERLPEVEQIFLLRDTPFFSDSGKVVHIGGRSFFSARNPLRHVAKVFQGCALCRRHRVDLVISILFYPHGYIGAAIARLGRVRHIHSIIAGEREFYFLGSLVEKVNLRLVRKLALLTVTGEPSLAYLKRQGVDLGRVRVLRNVIDMSRFRDDGLQKTCDVIYAGRMDPNKNLSVLVRACRLLRDRGLALRVQLVGDGPSRASLAELVRELGLQETVEFTGWKKPEEVRDLLGQARIFVLTSKGEGMPLAVLEAMACGAVPVCTAVGDVPDTVRHGENGLVVRDPNDPLLFADAIQKLLQEPDYARKLAVEAGRVRQEYSYEANMQHWSEMLKEI